jgi:hypothetical protein
LAEAVATPADEAVTATRGRQPPSLVAAAVVVALLVVAAATHGSAVAVAREEPESAPSLPRPSATR